MEKVKVYEKDIQRAICEWLQSRRIFFWRANNVPMIGRAGAGGEVRFRAMPKFTPKGIPDLIVLHKGEFIGLEVKVPGRKLRPDQAEFGVKVIENGGNYHMVASLEDVMKLPYWTLQS
jgi:hypothetical protein